MSNQQHGVIEDICVEIGYTASCALVDWFGGANLHIPAEASEDHAIAKVIGMPAFRRLVAMFSDSLRKHDRVVWIPSNLQRELDQRDRLIALLFAAGFGSKHIAGVTGMSERMVQHVRQRVETLGLLPLILKKAGVPGNASQTSEVKPGGESAAGNRPGNPARKPTPLQAAKTMHTKAKRHGHGHGAKRR